jgi:ribosomal protein S18 acetylase RimI-like enzyme
MMLTILKADLNNPQQAADLLRLLNDYALDPMGGGDALKPAVRDHLIAALKARPDFQAFLAYQGGEAVGLLNSFLGFSTFAAKPLLNLHDISVSSSARGQGVGQALIAAAEAFAMEQGCCKLTLEVLEGNMRAQGAYIKAGFAGFQLDPEMGRAMFWQKKLA